MVSLKILIEVCSLGYDRWEVMSGLNNGLPPNRPQTIIWTNDDAIQRRRYGVLRKWALILFMSATDRCITYINSGMLEPTRFLTARKRVESIASIVWQMFQVLYNTLKVQISQELITSNNTETLSWWRHQMQTFSALLALCAGNSPVTGEFPAQRPATRSFDVFFDLPLNKQLSKQSWGWWFETPSSSLWRQSNVYFANVSPLYAVYHIKYAHVFAVLRFVWVKSYSSWLFHRNVPIGKIPGEVNLKDMDKIDWHQKRIKPWLRHQMETFSTLLALCVGNSSVTGEFPPQRPVTRSFDVFFDLCLNRRLSK